METYLKLKTLISFVMGITNGLALAIIGLELPAVWALVTFLANFIPNIGAPITSILPCLIALLDVRKTLTQVAAAFISQLILHFTIGNFVEPIVFGTTEEIHSVVVLLGLSFFGYIWGLTGMFLSVPILFALHAWLDTVARTPKCPMEAREDARFIMGMLEGRLLSDSMEPTTEEGHSTMDLLTGQIEDDTGEGWDPSPKNRSRSPDGRDPAAQDSRPSVTGVNEVKSPPPATNWACAWELQELFTVRDPDTGEVRVQGLALRWIFLSGAYILLFFGFSMFGLDLAVLIHPSAKIEADTEITNLDGKTTTAAVTTTVAAIAGVLTTAVPVSAASAGAAVATVHGALRLGTSKKAMDNRTDIEGSDGGTPHPDDNGRTPDARPERPDGSKLHEDGGSDVPDAGAKRSDSSRARSDDSGYASGADASDGSGDRASAATDLGHAADEAGGAYEGSAGGQGEMDGGQHASEA